MTGGNEGISIIDVTSSDVYSENIKIDESGKLDHTTQRDGNKTIKTMILVSQQSNFVCDLTFNINGDLTIVVTYIKA